MCSVLHVNPTLRTNLQRGYLLLLGVQQSCSEKLVIFTIDCRKTHNSRSKRTSIVRSNASLPNDLATNVIGNRDRNGVTFTRISRGILSINGNVSAAHKDES